MEKPPLHFHFVNSNANSTDSFEVVRYSTIAFYSGWYIYLPGTRGSDLIYNPFSRSLCVCVCVCVFLSRPRVTFLRVSNEILLGSFCRRFVIVPPTLLSTEN